MDVIIVTVTDERSLICQDLEVPADLEASKLKEDIIKTLEGWRPEYTADFYQTRIRCGRTGKYLKDDETLNQAGVWNGDYLILCRA